MKAISKILWGLKVLCRDIGTIAQGNQGGFAIRRHLSGHASSSLLDFVNETADKGRFI